LQTIDPAPKEPPASPGDARHAGLLSKAIHGAFWTILSGTGARVFGILGTLAVTHYLSPEEYGEVSLAALVTLTASTCANAGVSQYIASKPNAERAAVFHATFYYLLLGVLALGLSVVLAGPFSWLINAPGIGRYLPFLAASTLVDRVCTIQDRIQVRDMRFRSVGLIRSLGELTYSVTSVLLAATCAGTMFGGPHALVWAMLARSVVRLVTLSATTPWREWAEPHRITMAQTREFFSFGLPMSLAGVANFGSGKFDNFVYAHHFGEAGAGKYNLAYNFADIPAALIAETVGDVLVPSFARMENDARRRSAFLLSLQTLVLLVTPLSLGLSAVAPDLVRLAFPPEYEGITRTLRILVMFAVPRTIIWTAIAYLQVRNEPRLIMVLEWLRLVGIVAFMHAVTFVTRLLLGPDAAVSAACAAVVLVFAASSLSYMVMIRRIDGVPLLDQIRPLLPPTLACAPMVLAVWAVQRGFDRMGIFTPLHPVRSFGERALTFGPRLLVEIVVGFLVFVPSALLLAPTASRSLLGMVGDALKRRRGEEVTTEASQGSTSVA
jgi:lipopolysaccharide exporter